MLSTSVINILSKTRWFKLIALSDNLTSNLTSKTKCVNKHSRNYSKDNPGDWISELSSTMRVYPNFITEKEEESLLREVEPYMKRLRYEFSHWDDAIHGYRETEKSSWNEENSVIIARVQRKAFPPGAPLLGHVHVLDLAAEGKIKPHVDSVRFCGDTIAGLSLISDSVMRLTMVGHEKERFKDILLPKRSLYIMSGTARYDYNHEILGSDESVFEGNQVPRLRRISVICRSEPDQTE